MLGRWRASEKSESPTWQAPGLCCPVSENTSAVAGDSGGYQVPPQEASGEEDFELCFQCVTGLKGLPRLCNEGGVAFNQFRKNPLEV